MSQVKNVSNEKGSKKARSKLKTAEHKLCQKAEEIVKLRQQNVNMAKSLRNLSLNHSKCASRKAFNHLQTENREMREEQNKLRAKHDKLRIDLDKAKYNVEVLKLKLKSRETEYSDLTTSFNELKKRANQYRSQCQDLTDANKRLQKQLETITSNPLEIKKLNCKEKEKEKEASQETTKKDLEKKLQHSYDVIERTKTELQHSHDVIKQTKTELQHIYVKFDKLHKTYKTKQQTSSPESSQQNAIKSESQIVQQLKRCLNRKNKQIALLKTHISDQDKQMEQLITEIKNHKCQIRTLQLAANHLQRDNQSLQHSLTLKQEEISGKNEADKQQQIDRLNKKLKEVQNELEEEKQIHHDTRSSLSSVKMMSKKQLQFLKQQLQEREDVIIIIEKQINKLQKQCELWKYKYESMIQLLHDSAKDDQKQNGNVKLSEDCQNVDLETVYNQMRKGNKSGIRRKESKKSGKRYRNTK